MASNTKGPHGALVIGPPRKPPERLFRSFTDLTVQSIVEKYITRCFAG